MKFTITINCDNDAFVAPGCEQEVIRILETLRYSIESGDADANARIPLHDINGNTVGHADFEVEDAS